MKQTVYVDVLLALNFFINYFLLLSVGRIMRSSVSRTRICLGAAFGALCSLTLFLPPMNVLVGCAVKLVISGIMVLIAFRQRDWRGFGRYVLVTCAVTFGFGGAMLALWLTLAPGGMYYRNGTVYFPLSPWFVIFVTVACYTVITLAGKICKKFELRAGECSAVIRYGEMAQSLRLIFDTGNLLTEPFSGLPVIVAKRSAVNRVLPHGFPADGLCGNFPANAEANFRIIPYSTVSGSGMLCAFRPASVLIGSGRLRRRVECYVAVTDTIRSDHDGIINPRVFD